MVWWNPSTWGGGDSSLGSVDSGPYITPAESVAGSTGTVVTGTPTSVTPTGSVEQAISSSSGGGGGGSPTPSPTPSTVTPSPISISVTPKEELKMTTAEGVKIEKEVYGTPTKTTSKFGISGGKTDYSGTDSTISAGGQPSGFVPIKGWDVKNFFGGILPTTASIMKGEAGFSNYFDAFRGRGQPKSEKELSPSDATFFTNLYGTGQYGTTISTGLPSYKDMTYGELQKEFEVKQGLQLGIPTEARYASLGEKVSKEVYDIHQEEYEKDLSSFAETRQDYYQDLIDTEQMGFSGASDLYSREISAKSESLLGSEKYSTGIQEAFTLQYEKEADILGGKISKSRVKGLSTTTGDIIADVGTFVGQAGVYTAAFSSPATAVIASSLLTGSSTKDFTTALIGKDLSYKERMFSLGSGFLKAGIGIYGFASVVAPTTTSMLARQSQRELIKDLQSQKFSLGGKELYRGDKGSLFRFSSSKVIEGGRASQDLDILAPIFKDKAGFLTMVGGKAHVTTRIQDVISDKVLTFSDDFITGGNIFGMGKPILYGKGKASIILDMQKNVQAGVGKGFILKRGSGGKMFEFPIAGVSGKQGDVLNVMGLKPTKLGLQKGTSQIFLDSKTAVTYWNPIKLKGSIEGLGKIKLISNFDDVVSSGKMFSGIKKTPFSSTFGEQVQVSGIGTSGGIFAPSITKQSFIQSTTGVQQALGGSMGVGGGLGFSATTIRKPEKSELKQDFFPSQTFINLQPMKMDQGLKIVPAVKIKMKQLSFTDVTSKFKQLQTQKQVLKQEQQLAPAFDFTFQPPITPYFKQSPFRFGLFIPPFIPTGGGGYGGSRTTATRKFIPTPSLGASLKFQLFGYGGGKTKESLARTGLVGRGFDFKVPKIELPSLLGKVKKKRKKK